MSLRVLITTVFAVTFTFFSLATDKGKGNKAAVGYLFEDEIVLPATPVKDQYRTGTCWSFSTLSFLESEMLRLGKPEIDLSEMFVVRYTYSEKANKYIRLHGENCFSAGGAFHDVTNVINKYGIVPESVYTGLEDGETKHVHTEMDNLLQQQVKAIVENKNCKLRKVDHETVAGTLNTYLGEVPQTFEFEGKN